jgi:hypothetical protein
MLAVLDDWKRENITRRGRRCFHCFGAAAIGWQSTLAGGLDGKYRSGFCFAKEGGPPANLVSLPDSPLRTA